MTQAVLVIGEQAAWFCERLAARCPGYRFYPALNVEQGLQAAEDAEILIGFAPQLSDTLLARMPKLKWIHALTTGVDNIIQSPALRPGVFVSNSKGIHGPQMSELAILLMLSSLRDFPAMLANQAAHKWDPWPQPMLYGRRVCIIGLGAIAEDLATRLIALGMTLSGVSDGRKQVPGFADIFPRSEIETAVAGADFVIVLAPYTPATRHIVNDRVLVAMGTNAILINLSRGECVDEAALVTRLRDRTIRAAALDVFAQEPLPANDPLWATPKLTMTPHIGGRSDVYREQVFPLIVRNLEAWSRGGGEALPDLVAPTA